jgi:uncharacterized membrane protein YhaH (DUF805 family)|tara:strand:+ start:362 stop:679 length:318 start_codon:yes stop_codon:yes gene_type:complete
MGIVEMMKFDASVSYTRKNWWMYVIGLAFLQIVVGIVLAIAGALGPEAIIEVIDLVWMIVVLWMSIGITVGRLRNRGHSELKDFALRLIIFPWGFVECAFLAAEE